MEQIKIGFKLFEITNEVVNNPLDGKIVIYKDKKYELYHFDSEEDFSSFINKYKTFRKYHINVPKIIAKSKKDLVVVREHFDVSTCLVLLANNQIDEKIIEKLFDMYRAARTYKFDLDYMPENYVFDGKKLYYLGLDIIKKNEKYSLENYGMFYWIYSKEGCKHLSEKGFETPKNKLNDAEAKKAVVLWVVKYW